MVRETSVDYTVERNDEERVLSRDGSRRNVDLREIVAIGDVTSGTLEDVGETTGARSTSRT